MLDAGSQGHEGPGASDGVTVDGAQEPGTPCVSRCWGMGARGAGPRGWWPCLLPGSSLGEGVPSGDPEGRSQGGSIVPLGSLHPGKQGKGMSELLLCSVSCLWSRTRPPVWSSSTGGVTAQNPRYRLGVVRRACG